MESNQQNRDFTISVVIPAYNNSRYIGRAIDSILAQTCSADEIIVVDDGSTDNTAEVVRSYGSKVNFIQQENAGAGAARNTGIEAARNEWLAFLDADDEWLPNKLKIQTELLQRNPQLAWVAGNYYRCLCWENRRAPDNLPQKIDALLVGKEFFQNYFAAFTAGLPGHTDTMLIKRDALKEAGLFTVGQLRANDMDMWWKLAYRWPQIGFVSEPIVIHHLDVSGSISRTYKDVKIYCNLIDRHLKLATQFNCQNDFKPCAVRVIRRWIRSMLFDARATDIRQMTDQFSDLLPRGYKAFMNLLTTFPHTTAAGCHLISRLVRLLHLRRRLVRKPK